MAAVAKADVVIVNYADLLSPKTSNELRAALDAAFSYDGPGLIAVRGIPDFVDARKQALPYAYALGHLSDDVKLSLERPSSLYSFGWSHGKEMLRKDVKDLSKGSFYANPMFDVPTTDADLIQQYPTYCAANVWPTEDELPGFKSAYQALAQIMVRAGAALASHCDNLCAQQQQLQAPPSLGLRRVVEESRAHKARMLYYFPVPQPSEAAPDAASVPAAAPAAAPSTLDDDVSSYCGWHNDHGSLTALTSSMYFDATGSEIQSPDTSCGLHVRSRRGVTLQVAIPPDCCAFQVGESAQIHSGGMLQATPHCVKAPAGPASVGVSRGTLAVFMQPMWHAAMSAPAGADERVLRGARGELLPPGVPPLASRWKGEQQTFGEFTNATWAAYY